MRREWIGRLDIDADTEAHISRHGLRGTQVWEAVRFDHYESAVWKDTLYGARLMVVGRSDDNVRVKAWISVVDRGDGHFELRTAVRI